MSPTSFVTAPVWADRGRVRAVLLDVVVSLAFVTTKTSRYLQMYISSKPIISRVAWRRRTLLSILCGVRRISSMLPRHKAAMAEATLFYCGMYSLAVTAMTASNTLRIFVMAVMLSSAVLAQIIPCNWHTCETARSCQVVVEMQEQRQYEHLVSC